MANTVNSLNYANTFADWLVATDALIAENNTLGKSDYHKDTGVLYLDNTSGNSLESKGNVFIQQALLVQGTSSSATIDNNLTVKYGTVYIKSQDPGTANIALVAHGQANVDGLLYARASGTGLLVSNNASILGDTVISGNTVAVLNTITNKVQANTSVNTTTLTSRTGEFTDLTVLNQLTVDGSFVLTGDTVYDSNIFEINSGSSIGIDSSFEVNRGTLAQNAKFLWKESEKVFKVVNVDTGVYYRLLSNEYLDNSISSTDETTIATSKALNTVSIQANAAFTKANTTLINFIGTNGTTSTANNNYVSWASNNGVLISGLSNTITVSTPQDLRTTASPTFNALSLTNALPVDQGGTGATNAGQARTNLLPTGTTAGYVLTTGGAGNFYWGPGGGSGGSGAVPGTAINSSFLDYTGNGSTVTYVAPTYIPGSNQLKVYLDGVRQYDGYTEASGTSVTFGAALATGTKIRLEVDGYYVNPYYANNISFTAPFGDIVGGANTIQLAIQDIETRKAALAGASFTGLATGLTLNANVSNTAFATTAYVKNVLGSGNTFAINAATVTNGVYTTGSYSDPSWLTITKTKVGLSNVPNTDATNATNISSGTLSASRLPYTMDQAVGTGSNVQHNSLGVGTGGSGTTGEIRATNDITAFYTSDKKFKENVNEIQGALGIVSAIGGKTFDWTEEYINNKGGEDGYFVRKNDFGVVAQDVQAAFPLAVRTKPDGTLAVDYEKMCAIAFAAINELKKEIDELKGNNK